MLQLKGMKLNGSIYMTTTYITMKDRVKQHNPSGSCFFDISLPFLLRRLCRTPKKNEKIIINRKKIKHAIRVNQAKYYTKMCQSVY